MTSRRASPARSALGRILSACNLPIAFALGHRTEVSIAHVHVIRDRWEDVRTRQLLFQILVIFVSVSVRGNVCAGFGVANVLHLMSIIFDTNLAEVPQSTHNRGHCKDG